MNRAFTFRKFDEQGRARLINEIKQLWEAISKITPETVKTSISNVNEVAVAGYAKSVDKFLNEQGDYTALDSQNTSTALSVTNSLHLVQSTVITTGDSTAKQEASSATSSLLTGPVSSAASLGVSAGTQASGAVSQAESAVTYASSADASVGVITSTADSSIVSKLDPIVLATSTSQAAEADKVKLWAEDYAVGDARLYVQGELGHPMTIGNNTCILWKEVGSNYELFLTDYYSALNAWRMATFKSGSGTTRPLMLQHSVWIPNALETNISGIIISDTNQTAGFGTTIGFGVNHSSAKYFKMVGGGSGAGFLYDNSGIFIIEPQPNWPSVGGSGIAGLTMDGTGQAYFGILGTASALGRVSIWTHAAAAKGLVIRGYTSQSANLLELQDVSGNILAQIDPSGSFVFNENSLDADCRIEGATDVNLFYTDAGNDRVGIGTTSPAHKLGVQGSVGSYVAEDTDFDLDEVISTGITSGFGLLIVRDSVDNITGLFRIEHQTIVIVSANALYTITKDNAATYNVYWDTDQFKVQNKVGNNKNTRVGFYAI